MPSSIGHPLGHMPFAPRGRKTHELDGLWGRRGAWPIVFCRAIRRATIPKDDVDIRSPGGPVIAPLTFNDAPVYAEYERLREQHGPVFWDERKEAWIVLGSEEVGFVVRHEDLFGHPDRPDLASPERFEDGASVLGGERVPMLLLDPEHRALHRGIIGTLSRRMDHYRSDFIRPVVERFLEVFATPGTVDFTEEFADRLPSAVITSVLGLPWQEDPSLLDKFKDWTNAIGRARESFFPGDEIMVAAKQAGVELDDALRPVVQARREQPEDDFISELWEIGKPIFPDWSETDVLAQCRVLYFAGSETTAHFLGNAGYLLFTQPTLWQRLVEDESLVSRFVEETLRLLAAVQFNLRSAAADVKLGGAQINKGDHLLTISAAASRDPGRYRCPHDIALDGESKGHFAFSVGPRTCPGAPLVRAEGREAIGALLKRLKDPHIDPEAQPPEFVGDMLCSWRPLNVSYELAAVPA